MLAWRPCALDSAEPWPAHPPPFIGRRSTSTVRAARWSWRTCPTSPPWTREGGGVTRGGGNRVHLPCPCSPAFPNLHCNPPCSCLFLGLMREPGYPLHKKSKHDVDIKARLVGWWMRGGGMWGVWIVEAGWPNVVCTGQAKGIINPSLPRRRCRCWPPASWCSGRFRQRWWRSSAAWLRRWLRCARRMRTCVPQPPARRRWRSSKESILPHVTDRGDIVMHLLLMRK